MTVRINKEAINLREKLSELDKPSGLVGEELLRADTPADAREALNLEEHLFEDFESTGIDDNATSTKVTVSDSGVDVTGTVTADGLTVDGATTINQASDTNSYLTLDGASGAYLSLAATTGHISADSTLTLNTASSERMRIDSSGKVGIGTSSPVEKLYVNSTSGDARIGLNAPTGSDTEIKFSNNGTVEYSIGHDDATDNFVIGTTNVDSGLVSVTKSGNVGIGESDPSGYWGQANQLVINDGNSGITIKSSSVGNGRLVFTDTKSTTSGLSDGGMITYGHATDVMTFQTAGTERARIDSSGNLLVGTTDTTVYNNSTGSGAMLGANGQIQLASTSTPVYLNRQGTNGDIAHFRKDGLPVGSIGNLGTRMYIDGSGVSGINFSSGALIPRNNGLASDNIINIGGASNRFKDLYLSGGVYLGGTGAANKLDDYEEGTWTPVLQSGTNITYTTQNGRYRKVGSIVNCTAEIVVSNSDADGSVVAVGGFPFATSSFEESCVATLGRYTDFLGAKGTAVSNFRFTGSAILLMQGNNTGVQYNQVASSGTLQMSFTFISG